MKFSISTSSALAFGAVLLAACSTPPTAERMEQAPAPVVAAAPAQSLPSQVSVTAAAIAARENVMRAEASHAAREMAMRSSAEKLAYAPPPAPPSYSAFRAMERMGHAAL